MAKKKLGPIQGAYNTIKSRNPARVNETIPKVFIFWSIKKTLNCFGFMDKDVETFTNEIYEFWLEQSLEPNLSIVVDAFLTYLDEDAEVAALSDNIIELEDFLMDKLSGVDEPDPSLNFLTETMMCIKVGQDGI